MANARGDRFVWYELLTTDAQSAKTFYADVVGWKARDISMPGATYSVFTVADNAVTGVMEMPESTRHAGAIPHWIGYMGVPDLDATISQVEKLGGAIRVPPMNIPGVSRFSIVADPQEATFAMIKGMVKPSQAPSVPLGTPGHVGWHELFAGDWETAFNFYSDLFGWRKAHADDGPTGKYQQFSVAGATIGAISAKPATLPLPFWLHYFNVSDIDAASKRVEDGGGSIFYGPLAVPGGAWMVHCKDPQGALFGLLDRRSRKVLETFVASNKRTATPSK